MQTILIADDDPILREVLALYLKRDGFAVLEAADGEQALTLIRERNPDLLVLDLMMPRIDGWEICRRVRAERSLPILILTARGEEHERILGLGLGADDYVVKPFSPGEVAARIKAIFRRIALAQEDTGTDEIIRSGALEINPGTHEVRVDGQFVALTAREFELLHYLARHPRQVFSADALLRVVWGYSYAGESGTVAVHIRHVREKIEPDPARPRYLETVWGVGYRFQPGGES